MFPWIYRCHGGIVDKALKALEAIESVIENDDHLQLVKNAMTDILTSWKRNGKIMQIVFVKKDANTSRRFAFSNDKLLQHHIEAYASSRKVSLKSLRFSHKGKLLFVSSLGQQTLVDLGIQDKDEIIVDDTVSLTAATRKM